MEQLIELLTQIQDLAGAGIDALQQVSKGAGAEAAPPEGPGGPPPEGAPEGGGPPPEGA